ncbi:MAG: FitA-like ribbon-helix-helix domain-containing protein [Thermoanaerobaculia bacterium]
MAQLIVRKLEDRLVQALKERAGRHGRSAEAEHREILRQTLLVEPAEDAKTVLLEMPNVGEDVDFARIHELPRALDL